MAIINCPEYQRQISDKAETCPNCAYPISAKQAKIVVKKKEGCFLQTMNLGCLVIILFVALFIGRSVFTRIINNENKIKIENENKNNIYTYPKGGRR